MVKANHPPLPVIDGWDKPKYKKKQQVRFRSTFTSTTANFSGTIIGVTLATVRLPLYLIDLANDPGRTTIIHQDLIESVI